MPEPQNHVTEQNNPKLQNPKVAKTRNETLQTRLSVAVRTRERLESEPWSFENPKPCEPETLQRAALPAVDSPNPKSQACARPVN